uniref:Uncharacterized protein n=1 Tax=Glossina brevipalpis TaxID=37001 RepID=A0A1A9WK16_9MUSC
MAGERSTHHQRRPPDVEEALSSMLWTPYERSSTDNSSEDEDERLLQRDLKSSFTSFCTDYATNTAYATLDTEYVTFIPTSMAASTTVNALQLSDLTSTAATTCYFAAAAETFYEPLENVATPLVPLSSSALVLNTRTQAITNYSNDDSTLKMNTEHYPENRYYHKLSGTTNDNITYPRTSPNVGTAATRQSNKRSLHSRYAAISSLTKWWSPMANAATNSSTDNRSAVTIAETSSMTAPISSLTSSSAAIVKQPPSYESLYATTKSSHHNKHQHLHLFKPMSNTLKANVTSITQTRSLTETTAEMIMQQQQPGEQQHQQHLTNTSTNAYYDAESHFVRSFTDDFIVESFKWVPSGVQNRLTQCSTLKQFRNFAADTSALKLSLSNTFTVRPNNDNQD